MSYWMMTALIGGIGAVGVGFAVLILRLDESVENELRLDDEDRRWTSII